MTRGTPPRPAAANARRRPPRRARTALPARLGPAAAGELPRHFAAIVEHSHDAIFSRSLGGIVTSWNAAATRIFGFRAEEILGRSSRVLIPRGHRDEFRRLMARIRRGAVIEHFETERLRKDGRRIHVSLTMSPIRDDAGRLIGTSTTARDITEQRRVHEALERRERELADLFEEASVGLVLASPDGRILRANPAALALLECRAPDCVGVLLARFHPDRPLVSGLLARLARRETLRNFQTALRSRRGRLREVLIDASAVWDRGRVDHTRWFLRDITRRKQLEREVLAISERERRAFSSELHDSLGQQLSGIAYLSNVARDRLRDQGLPESAQVAQISRLLRQAIEEVRRVSRGLSPVPPDPEGLHQALTEFAANTGAVFGATCRFRCPKPVAVPDSEAATHLYRIAQEAVTNALRHGQARRITIGLVRQRGQVILSITDNGRGIGALSPRRKGLGLRVMQYRAGLLQGTLVARRRPVGGTEVRCVVPAASLTSPAPG